MVEEPNHSPFFSKSFVRFIVTMGVLVLVTVFIGTIGKVFDWLVPCWGELWTKNSTECSTNLRNVYFVVFALLFGVIGFGMSYWRNVEAKKANKLKVEGHKEEQWNIRFFKSLELMVEGGTSGVIGLESINTMLNERNDKDHEALNLIAEFLKSLSNEYMDGIEEKAIGRMQENTSISKQTAVEQVIYYEPYLPAVMMKTLRVISDICKKLNVKYTGDRNLSQYVSLAGADIRWLSKLNEYYGIEVYLWRFDFSNCVYKVTGGLPFLKLYDCRGYDKSYFVAPKSSDELPIAGVDENIQNNEYQPI